MMQALKLSAVIFAPLLAIAGVFGLYLDGFRDKVRLDMQRVVLEAVDKHVEKERLTYALTGDLAALRAELQRVEDSDKDLKRQVELNTRILERLAQKNGLH